MAGMSKREYIAMLEHAVTQAERTMADYEAAETKGYAVVDRATVFQAADKMREQRAWLVERDARRKAKAERRAKAAEVRMAAE